MNGNIDESREGMEGMQWKNFVYSIALRFRDTPDNNNIYSQEILVDQWWMYLRLCGLFASCDFHSYRV